VLAIDDQPHFRSALRCLIEATWPPAAYGEADSGEAGIALARELEPDVVLIDVRMPGIGGIRAAEEIKAIRPQALVLLICTTHPDQLSRQASECPADRVLWKDDLRPHLLVDLWSAHVGSDHDR
jgi:DNA-binding NarL/FixJ family response regulator